METLSERWDRESHELGEAVQGVVATHLANASGVGLRTIMRIRRRDGWRPDPETIDAIWSGLDRLGVE